MERKDYNCHILSNTHWDREWRYPFRSYQMDLVDLMDGLLDLLETEPEYRSFYLDSQTLILEDYLEVRPENRERVKAQVAAGRLEIGPWYTLPDAWGTPGEALVRNLLFGHRDAAALGGVTKCGYTPFSNGQISQMPQLYRGFGIDSIMFYRGIGKHIAPSDFLWQGADGSRLFAFRFGDFARYNYYYLCYRDGLYGRTSAQREYAWNPQEVPYHVASDQEQDRQYGWINQTRQVHPEMLRPSLDNAMKYTAPDARTNELMYMMGHDHSFAAKEELDLIRALAKEAGPEGEKIFHSCFTDYMNAFRAAVDEDALKVVTGEMRHTLKEGLWTTLMALILSCRLYLKQRNAQVCRGILEGAEPLSAMAWITGSAYPTRVLEIAWRHLLVNHAHDAIGGCSVDKVHRAMETRWDEVETISDELIRRSMRDVVSRIDGVSALKANDLQLTVFNTTAFVRSEIAEFIIDVPRTSDDDGAKSVALRTHDGSPVDLQILSCETYEPTIEGGYETTMQFAVNRYRVAAELNDLPPVGWSVFGATPTEKIEAAKLALINTNGELENEFLRVSVNGDGTVCMTEKRTGRVMDGLLSFEDAAEFGDPWNRKMPADDVAIFSRGQVAAKASVVCNGHLKATLQVEYALPLPAGRDGNSRSKTLVENPVVFELTLRKGSPKLEVALTIENRVENHRLRVLVPTGVSGATNSYADGQFDVLQRPIAMIDSTDWKEKPYPTHPMWSFVGVSDGDSGVAVLQDGLTEYEVKDDAQRTVAITLMRTFGTTVYARPAASAQMLGKHHYRFAIVPHAGDWQTAQIQQLAAAWLTPVYAIESAPTRGTLPCRHSMVELQGNDLNLTGIKQAENGKDLIVRFYNASTDERQATLKINMPISSARLVTLEELPDQDLAIQPDGTILVTAPCKKIITVSCVLKG